MNMGQITVTLDLDDLAFEAVEQETNVEHLIRQYCAEEVQKHIREKVLDKLGDQMSTQAKAMIEKEVNAVIQRQLEGKIIHFYDMWGREKEEPISIDDFVRRELEDLLNKSSDYKKEIARKLDYAMRNEVERQCGKLVEEAREKMMDEIRNKVGSAVLKLAGSVTN